MNGIIATLIGSLAIVGGIVIIGIISIALQAWAQHVSNR